MPGVRIVRPGGVTGSDSSGRYTLRAQAGVQQLRVFCPSATLFSPQQILQPTVEIHADSVTRLDLRIRRDACTEPPRDSVDGEFAGHFVSEFEDETFVPCPAAAARLWSPPGEKATVWLRFTPASLKTGPRPWPRAGRGTRRTGAPRFGRFKGRLTGPGSYGHLGLGSYQLTVEEILDVRTPGPGDCG